MSIVINPNIPLIVAPGATADVVLQPGSVVSALVLQILGNEAVRIAIGNQSIDVLSQLPLQAGQTLQLAVSQTADGIRLVAVNQQGGTAASQGFADLADAAATPDSLTLAPGATAGIAAAEQTTPGVAPKNQLTPPEALAVSVAAQTAATQQTSLAPLFANLGVAAGLNGLPPQVQQAVAQLLAQRTGLDQGLTGDDIKQAFRSSGLFLETSLASGSPSPSVAAPDLKAALIVLRQVLATSLDAATVKQNTPAPTVTVPEGATPTAAVVRQGTTAQATVTQRDAAPQPVTIAVGPQTPTTASPALAPQFASGIAAPEVLLQGATLPVAEDIVSLSVVNPVILPASTPADAAARSAALHLLQEVIQPGPLTAGNPSGVAFGDSLTLSALPAVTGNRTLNMDDAEFARSNVPPPPIGGALPAAQPAMPATLGSSSSPETAMHHLLADTDAAVARQTLLQVASLPDRVDTTAGRLDPTAPRWSFEIPFATSQGTAMAQFEISRDGSGREPAAAKRVWRARFSLDIEPAGPVHVLVSLSGDTTSVRMWAERPATAEQLRAGVSQLSQALSRAALLPGEIVVRDGAPVQPAPARAGHFLDRAL